MCWNKDVSLNTFLFSIFTLMLIIYNNNYTKYKLNEINNIFSYIFLLSFISMQLIEYFLWQNLNNTFYNKILSFAAASLIFIQPIASIFVTKNVNERNVMLFIYLLFGIPFSLFKMKTTKFSTSIAQNGHLVWDWIDHKKTNHIHIFYLFYLFFLFYPLVREKLYFSASIAFLLLLISFYSYYKDGTADSMWCWSVNAIMLYFLIKLLIILPFYK